MQQAQTIKQSASNPHCRKQFIRFTQMRRSISRLKVHQNIVVISSFSTTRPFLFPNIKRRQVNPIKSTFHRMVPIFYKACNEIYFVSPALAVRALATRANIQFSSRWGKKPKKKKKRAKPRIWEMTIITSVMSRLHLEGRHMYKKKRQIRHKLIIGKCKIITLYQVMTAKKQSKHPKQGVLRYRNQSRQCYCDLLSHYYISIIKPPMS